VGEEHASDDRVLALRTEGQSFGAIAKAMSFARASEAYVAFQRAVRRRSASEQLILREQELRRLDVVSKRLAALPDVTDEELDCQLRIVARLREMVLTG
jgi:hypothetical protein